MYTHDSVRGHVTACDYSTMILGSGTVFYVKRDSGKNENVICERK